jgi:hypothetical protein
MIVEFEVMFCSNLSLYLLLQLMRCEVKVFCLVMYVFSVTKL